MASGPVQVAVEFKSPPLDNLDTYNGFLGSVRQLDLPVARVSRSNGDCDRNTHAFYAAADLSDAVKLSLGVLKTGLIASIHFDDYLYSQR